MTQSGNFWIHPRMLTFPSITGILKSHFYIIYKGFETNFYISDRENV